EGASEVVYGFVVLAQSLVDISQIVEDLCHVGRLFHILHSLQGVMKELLGCLLMALDEVFGCLLVESIEFGLLFLRQGGNRRFRVLPLRSRKTGKRERQQQECGKQSGGSTV